VQTGNHLLAITVKKTVGPWADFSFFHGVIFMMAM